jgi:hypothetical protein
VVDLTQIKLATTEDRTRHRDLWAAFFKAKSWEDLKMLAQQDKNIEQAVSTVHKLSEDELVRERYWAREDFLRQQIDHDLWYTRKFEEQDAALAKQAARIAELEAQLAAKQQ